MRLSSAVLAVGAVVFVVPIPGTFIAGGLGVLAGAVARRRGH